MTAFGNAGLALGAWLAFGAMAGGCHSVEAAARRDPMRCERDPACSKGRASYADCSQQCVDGPDCVDRCRQAQSDRVGHP